MKHGLTVVDSPCVIAMDRLSELPDEALVLRLLNAIDEVLIQHPALTGNMGGAQRWRLSQEYLELARQYVLAAPASENVMSRYLTETQAAGPEASIIQTIATVYADELAQLLPPEPEHPAWPNTSEVIWIWDGEPLAQWWVGQHAAHRAVHCVDMAVDTFDMSPWVDATRASQLLVTDDAESQAHAAAQVVLDWLLANPRQSIAVAVVDRLLARRMSAKLNASGVFVDDRTGWRLSTTVSASWITQWVEFARLASVKTFCTLMDGRWWSCCPGLTEAAVRLKLLKGLAALPDDVAWVGIRTVLARETLEGWESLDAAISTWLGTSERTVSSWAQALLQLLDEVSGVERLASDRAGDACIQVLRMLARAGSDRRVPAHQFAVMWEHALEQSRFRPQDVASQVRMLPLLSMRLQRFDAVLILGCAQKHFLPSPPGLLPPAVAAELGLPGPLLAREQQLAALVEMMCTHPRCVLTASRTQDGQPEPLLGLLLRVGLYWKKNAAHRSTPWEKPWVLGKELLLASPTHAVDGLKLTAERLSHEALFPVSAMGDLAACPLRFALTRASRWKDEPAINDKSRGRDRGDLIHAVIETFHRQTPHAVLAQLSFDEAVARMQTALDSVWKRYSPGARQQLFEARWEFVFVMSRLVLTLLQRAQEGWEVASQELPKERILQWGSATEHAIKVHGRIDRLEINARAQQDGLAHAVVDIKTGSKNSVAAQAKDPESWPQLSAYQWLLDLPSAELRFLHVDKKDVKWYPVKASEESSLGEQWAERSSSLLAELAAGGPAVPNPGVACEFCTVAGACRAGWWANQQATVSASTEGSDD